MSGALTIKTEPAKEPVTTAEAKLHLRVDLSDDDALIDTLIITARRMVESECLHALITQTWEYFIEEFPEGEEIELPWPPLQSVTSVKYKDYDGDTNTLSTDVYFVDTDSTPGRIILKPGQSWPGDSLYPGNPITIEFECGFGTDTDDLPAEALAAVKLLTADLYENRCGADEMPSYVQLLLIDLWAKAKKF